ncbi:MAG: YCF48-related protein [Cytophagales bacterium]
MLTNIFTKSSKYVALALALSSLNACQKKEYEPLYETPTLTSQASGVTTRLTRVQFLNTNVGYVSGLSGVILKTTDAGANWVKQNSGITTNLSSISFANENVGYAAGAATGTGTAATFTILKTTDGGNEWKPLSISGTGAALNTIKFVTEKIGWVAGAAGRIFKTTDGGSTWVQQTNFDTLGMRPSWIEKRLEDGESITATGGTVAGTAIQYLHAKNENELFALASSGIVYHTTNGGETWKWYETHSLEALYGISFVNDNTAYLCGANGCVLKMNPNFVFEDKTNKANTRSFRDLHFRDEQTGYVFGEHGYIFKTIDGGTYWGNEVAPEQFYIFYSCFFTSPTTGYLVGNNGNIVKLQDVK